MKAYFVDESMYHKGQYKIRINLEIYNEMCATGPINSSFNILAARLMGMEYAVFLRYIRQEFSAELHGSKGKYVSYSFPDKSKANELIKVLNKRWNILMALKPI